MHFKISETGEATPTKIGVHIFYIHSYLHELFEPNIISKTGEATPIKIGVHAFTSTLTCMNFLSQFYFLTPMDYSPWSERETWPFLKASEKGQNL